jgi:sec-independent protein translocase protein TatB
VFGLSFGELCVLLIVAIVVLGPKDLPRYLRKAGLMAGRLRRFAFEMRQKSGIDELLRAEGIDLDIAEIRRLARGEVAGVAAAVRSTADLLRAAAPAAAPYTPPAPALPAAVPAEPAPAPSPVGREYPSEGADSYGALPDTAAVYDGSFPASPLADDLLYTRGEERSPTLPGIDPPPHQAPVADDDRRSPPPPTSLATEPQ